MAVSRTRRAYTDTTEYIRMQGDAVLSVVETVTKVVSLESFIADLRTKGDIVTPIFPSGTKLYRKKDTKTILVVEKPPQTRTVTWLRMDPDTTKTRWKLAFPYTVYVFGITEPTVINTCRVYYTTKSITKLDDYLYNPNLCNLYADHKVCAGYSGTGMRAIGTTLAEKVESYIAAFWHSEFNSDLNEYHWDAYAGDRRAPYPQLQSLENWQKATTDNPLFPLTDIAWKQVCTLEQLVNELTANQAADY